MDETRHFAQAIVDASSEIERLAGKRVDLVKEQERIRGRLARNPGATQKTQFEQEVATYDRKLAQLEQQIEFQKTKVRGARDSLAKKNRLLDAALEQLEAETHRARRPPVGQGIRLSEEDFRRAQSSVPQLAFVSALIAVVVVAVFAISSLSLPTWISILLTSIGLALTAVFGVGGLYYARRADQRAVQDDLRRAGEAATSGPDRDASGGVATDE